MDHQHGNPGRLSVPLLILFVVVIISNLYVIAGMRDISQTVDNLPKQYIQETGHLRERVESISRAMQAMQQEAAWYSHPRIEIERGETGAPDALAVSWSFRELSRDAEVGVHYRIHPEEQWREATVRPQAPLSFSARMPLPEALVPTMEIRYERAPEQDDSRSVRVEAMSTHEGSLRVEYVISASDGQEARSGGRENVDIGHWASLLMGSIVEVDRNRLFNVTLVQVDRHRFESPELSELSSVHFVVRDRDGEVIREPLELEPDGGMWRTVVELGEELEIAEAGFLVETADGRELEKTIPFN